MARALNLLEQLVPGTGEFGIGLKLLPAPLRTTADGFVVLRWCEAHDDRIDDFQGRCHSSAAIQMARTKDSARTVRAALLAC